MQRNKSTVGRPRYTQFPENAAPKVPQKRAAQPWREPPSNPRGSRLVAVHQEDGEEVQQEDGEENPPSSAPDGSKKLKQAKAWDERRDPSAAGTVAALPQVMLWEQELRQLEVDHIQKRLLAVAPDVILRHCAGCTAAPEDVTEAADKEALYLGERFIAPLRVPRFKCPNCPTPFSAQPEDIGCSPFTPVNITLWAHSLVLERVKIGALVHGFSADGELSCLRRACLGASTDATACPPCSFLPDAPPLCDVLRPLRQLHGPRKSQLCRHSQVNRRHRGLPGVRQGGGPRAGSRHQ